MSDVETTDTAVSSAQVDADSLEFTVNTNLPLPATKASPGGAAPSLQELIEAELSVRLLQPDSLEPPASPTLHSLLSCDSIEPVTARTGPALSLDSLTGLQKDPHGQTDVESGIDMLSPTKLDDLSNPDSLESSSDLPGSPGHYSPEPAVEVEEVSAATNGSPLLLEDFSPPMNDLLIVEEGDLVVTHSDQPQSSSTPLLERHVSPPPASSTTCLKVQESVAEEVNFTDRQREPPLLRITEAEYLSDGTFSHSSRSEQHLGTSETSSSRTPDFSTSDGVATQEDASSHNTSDESRETDAWRGSSHTSGDSLNSYSVAEEMKCVTGTPTETSEVLSGHTEATSSELIPTDLSSSQGGLSSRDLSSSPLSLSSPVDPPSPTATTTILSPGALPPSDTNRVCGDVSSNAGDDDSGGEVMSATASSGDSREVITPSSDPNMDLHRLDDEDDDFWRNRGDDDDDDDVPYRSYLAKNEEEELGEEAVESTVTARNEDGYAAAEEEEGPQGSNHVGGVNEEDVVPPEGDECLETDGKAAQNGVRATTTEKKKKKKKSEDGEKKSKKKKKKRKGDAEKENKKAAYQYRDDLLQKHVGPRVRSFDASKMKSKFEKPKQVTQVPSECRQCGKQVFQMEKIVAEKASWHKNCFRCKECNTILTLETYQSHEGVLYCKPHFKDLFRPKAVIEDPDEARRERLMRRPKMIVLESKPEALPDDVVRSTDKPDYGLEELSNTNLKQKFAMFELISAEEEQSQEPIPVRRSQSLLSKAARFMQSEDDSYGVENSELGEYEEDDEEEDEEEEEEEDDEEDADKVKKKGRPTSFSGMQDLKAGWAQKKRRDEMTRKRREELAKFRQMLCAGKNITTREMFESGNFEDLEKRQKRKEPINIEGRPAAKNLRERFEKGLSLQEDEEDRDDEPREVDHVFREAETASKARSLFKQIDSAVQEGNEPVLRVRSSAQARRENRLSRDGKRIRNITSQVYNEQSKDSDEDDDEDEDEDEDEDIPIETSTLIDRFKFFATYEERAKQEEQKRRKVFRITPPRDGADKGIDVAEQELGRDPNLIRCTDNYQDEVDCRSTRNVLAMFRKMEMQTEEDDRGPRPLKRFTPPPEGEDDESDEDEYSDEEEYSDEDEEDESEDDDEEDDEYERKPKYKDEVLEMVKSSQSAKKAASLRAKFEKWESEVERNNEYNRSDRPEDEEECMPSIDTARNLRAMFENKAQEASRPVTERPKIKVNRFV